MRRLGIHRTLLLVTILGFGVQILAAQSQSERASEKQQTEKELIKLRAQIKTLQRSQQENRNQLSEEQQALKTLDIEINQSRKTLRATQEKLKQSQDQLGSLNAKKQRLTQAKTQQQKALASQIRSAYMGGKQEYLKVLLNQEDPAKLGRALMYYDYLNKARAEQIDALKETLSELESVIPAIAQEEQHFKDLESKQQRANKQLVSLKANRQKVVVQLKNQVSSNDKKLAEWQANEQDLIAIMAALEQQIAELIPEQALDGLDNFRGKLNWPVKGKLKEYFGRSRQGSTARWSGVLISAPSGNQVHAIHHGRVVFSDYLRGFGLITIIDHGAGFMSLYGHNESLYKNPGDWVEAGEPIATVGQTGGYPQTGLYFEIRHKSRALNPVRFIRRG